MHDEYLEISCRVQWTVQFSRRTNSNQSAESDWTIHNRAMLLSFFLYLLLLLLTDDARFVSPRRQSYLAARPASKYCVKSRRVVPFVFSRVRNSPRLSRYRFGANYKSSLRHSLSLSLCAWFPSHVIFRALRFTIPRKPLHDG